MHNTNGSSLRSNPLTGAEGQDPSGSLPMTLMLDSSSLEISTSYCLLENFLQRVLHHRNWWASWLLINHVINVYSLSISWRPGVDLDTKDGRKVMTNLDSILKSRNITLPTNVCLVKAIAFPVVVYGCESWTKKKAEHRRIDAFELWCWRRLLKSPLDCNAIQPVHPKGNQSWVFIGRTDAQAETLILWQPEVKNWITGKDPDAGKDWR